MAVDEAPTFHFAAVQARHSKRDLRRFWCVRELHREALHLDDAGQLVRRMGSYMPKPDLAVAVVARSARACRSGALESYGERTERVADGYVVGVGVQRQERLEHRLE